ncbi:MAG: serine O-acetyltransferase [Anaerolineae bacterium]
MSEYLQNIDGKNRENEYRGPLGRLRLWRDLLREDIETIYRKDPAARSAWEVLTCYPGLHAVWLHRPAHALWEGGHPFLARLLSHVARFLTGVEIHPGARIGRRFFIDHGSGVVIGETAEVGDDVLMYQGAVLGGTSAERTKRHPSVEDGVVIGANAVLLGNITIGARSKVGSGSVVVESVPVGATVVGIPGRVVRVNGRRPRPSSRDVLDHGYLPDPIVETLRCVVDRVELLEAEVRHLSRTSPLDLEEPVPMGCQWLEAGVEEGKSDGSGKS